jgi:hypothetical protein
VLLLAAGHSGGWDRNPFVALLGLLLGLAALWFAIRFMLRKK